MKNMTGEKLFQQIGAIIIISIGLALLYNAFSPKGIALIQTAPVKVQVSDSALFAPEKVVNDTAGKNSVEQLKDSVKSVMNERAHPGLTPKPTSKTEPKTVYKIISLPQLKRLMSEHRGMLIDARNADEFLRGHIGGARNIPFMEAEDRFEEIMAISRDTLILIYCTNPECHLGRGLAEFMNVMEFKNILLYDDGWDAWVKAGMPTEPPASQDSLHGK